MMTATGSPFPPQCFVIVPPLSASSNNSGGGNGNGDGGDNSNGNHCQFQNPANSSGLNISRNNFLLNSFVSNGSTLNLGSFGLSMGSYSKNLQIASPDIITEWVKAQMKEFSNYKFPRFDIILPKFPKRNKENKKLKPLEKISQSPYFEIKREKLEINYPSFSREELDELEEGNEDNKKENKEKRNKLKQDILELDELDFDEFGQDLENLKKKIKNIFSQKDMQEDSDYLEDVLDRLKKIIELKEDAKKEKENEIDSSEEEESVREKNIESLKSYQEEIDKMKKLPKKIKKTIKNLEKINDVISDYWSTWTKKNKKAAKEWKKFGKKTTAIIKTWNEIPQLFKDFTTTCTPGGGGGATSVNRGSLLTWVMKILLSSIKFPVIPMPQFPDIVVDLSKVKIGVSMTIPEISFHPVNVSLPDISGAGESLKNDSSELAGSILKNTLSGFLESFDQISNSIDSIIESLGGIENIPNITKESLKNALDPLLKSLERLANTMESLSKSLEKSSKKSEDSLKNLLKLPPMPSIVPEIVVPVIDLPQLPTLLPPPQFPNILKPVTTIVSIIKPFVKNILCMLSMGIIPIPEWKVASRVVQQTNRTGLLPMDFVFSAQLPGIPKITLPTIEIAPPINLVPAFDSINVQIKGMAQTLNNLTNMMSAMGKGGIPALDNIVPEGEPLSAIETEKEEFIKFVAINIYDQVGEFAEIDNSKVLAKIREISNSGEKIELDFMQQKEKSRLEKQLASYRGLLANNGFISSSDTPDFLPDGFGTASYDLANSEPVPVSKLYYFSSETNKSESITDFPINGRTHNLDIYDLDEDGNDEVIYSLDRQLFMKRLVDKNLTESEEENIYSAPDNLIYQNFAEFAAHFSPNLEYETETNSSESELEFLPPKSHEISYFEWIISDRPDRLFEENKNSNQKVSEEWNRIGFLIRPKGHKYEIRQGTAQIKKVVGNPILYGNALEKIKIFSKDDCKNDEIIKPFFPQETILVGIAKESKFKVRTKKRAGQQESERDIILRAGEETIVDFAEICPTKGEVKYVNLSKIEKFTPKSGDHFFSNMRLELGKNDEVELSLFNDTKVNIYGGERYELYSFNSRENFIGHIKKLPLGNHYGQFVGFNSKGKSFTYSKNLLHDPQLGDDQTEPEIIISQGSKIVSFITQKIEIDASESYDNQKISRVWWKRDGKIFLDSNDEKYSVMQLLNIEIPAKNTPQTFFVTLNIEDESGNVATQEIPVEIIVPNLKLSDVSLRDQEILGKIVEGVPGLKVGFLRERNGRKDILEQTVLSGDNGRFVMGSLNTTGNILLKDKQTKKIIAEILETGRPVINNKKEAHSRITKNPFAIKLFNSSNENLAVLNLKTTGKNDIQINSFVREIPANLARNSNNIQVVDSDNDDNFVWKSFSDGVVFQDNLNNRTIGIMNNNGQFTTTDYLQNLAIKPKKAESEKDPLIFQIYNKEKILAEFFIPIKEIIVQ